MNDKSEGLYIPSLDGIRASAAFIVFVSHAGSEGVIPGLFGVTVFFFLSGYLITTLLRIEYERYKQISLRKFYLRRIFRILPPMYIVLAMMAILAVTGVVPSKMTWDGLLAQFAHLSNYYQIFFGETGIAPDTGAMWSLAVEEHFYLLFPLCLILLLRRFGRRRAAIILTGVCILVLAWRCALVQGFKVDPMYTRAATDARLDSILFGCIMALGMNPMLDAKSSVMSDRQWAVVLALAVVALVLSFVYREPLFREAIRYSVQGVALFPVFYCAVRFPHWSVFRWTEWRAVRGFGLISYTFYLCHQMSLKRAEHYLGNTLGSSIIGFVAAVAFSILMYLLVEKRMADWRRRLQAR